MEGVKFLPSSIPRSTESWGVEEELLPPLVRVGIVDVDAAKGGTPLEEGKGQNSFLFRNEIELGGKGVKSKVDQGRGHDGWGDWTIISAKDD